MEKRALLKWSLPIISTITLPAHAQTSNSTGAIFNIAVGDLQFSNTFCNETSPVAVGFTVMNNTDTDIIISEYVDMSSSQIGQLLNSPQLEHVSPTLPVTVPVGESLVLSLSATERTTSCGENFIIEYVTS